ncbi:unnamed protein product, partial [Polarella glacialis]
MAGSIMFTVWIAGAAALALAYPPSFLWLPPTAIKWLLGILVFFMGTAASPSDFHACLRKPRPFLINFVGCFAVAPALALGLARLACLPEPFLVGMVLVGGVNGGSSSNLFTLFVGGDVALSVLMTVTTTLSAVVCTPLVAKVCLGAIVPVDSWGILHSAFQLVMLPISLGVFASYIVHLVPHLRFDTGCSVVWQMVPEAMGVPGDRFYHDMM